MRGTAAQGWRSPGLSILTDGDLFGWVKARRLTRPRRRREVASADAFFAELKPGDYVVHIEHGIGMYQGLAKRAVDGSEREFLLLEYAAGDRLYVPTSQADRVSRYVGGGEAGPALHRLGTAEWGRVKAQARRAIEDLADELLELYAARQVLPGHAFGPDTSWQREMESSFPYVETEDQLVAVEAVKSDMERPAPMDRLICGDVGYGKTEVALRAAFKAVVDGKQVAVLVPTTVLAQQHTRPFRPGWPRIPSGWRCSPGSARPPSRRRWWRGCRSGKVDIVIGTHRLLQEDVAFKDLGLLVIDEEQRFGVTHKERLKRMRKEVDVLTLTATPIPRTLHLAMMGARDMSTIDTPPEERLPIRTVIAAYDEELIRRAILREMERGGQVYFVHNRVRGIEQVAKRLRKIVPEASFAVGHGQMGEGELARVMRDFIAQRSDVLVCTSIIESGLDIPNANTIIVNRADRFGLAQLYQLRGRVGQGGGARLRLPSAQPGGGDERGGAQAAEGHLRGRRAGGRFPGGHAGHGDPGGGRHPGLPPARPHQRHRLRPVLPAPGQGHRGPPRGEEAGRGRGDGVAPRRGAAAGGPPAGGLRPRTARRASSCTGGWPSRTAWRGWRESRRSSGTASGSCPGPWRTSSTCSG